ncbi:hypothetical protein E4T56_gene6402, partial [Termitomyces sp. T112]
SFPTKFVYEASKRTWKERQRGTAIGRMYFASPQQGERFYLRMLLTVVTNATSWADLRTVNDDQYYLDHTILSGKNSDVEDINSEVLQKCPGEEKILQSADSIISDDGNPNGLGLYPMEYLNSLRASSLPLAKLALKIGVPVMLLKYNQRTLQWDKNDCHPHQHQEFSDEIYQSHLGPRKHIKKDCKYCLSGDPEWFTNHLMSIAGPCSIDILNGLQFISNIYQWTL